MSVKPFCFEGVFFLTEVALISFAKRLLFCPYILVGMEALGFTMDEAIWQGPKPPNRV